MKKCSTCKEEKPLSDYHKKGNDGTHDSVCKRCFSKYCISRWAARKAKAVEYKGGRCSKCGYSRSMSALEFHHKVPSEKDFDWGKIRLQSEEKMLAELDKCVLLCANCHREEHDLIRASTTSNS